MQLLSGNVRCCIPCQFPLALGEPLCLANCDNKGLTTRAPFGVVCLRCAQTNKADALRSLRSLTLAVALVSRATPLLPQLPTWGSSHGYLVVSGWWLVAR